MGRSRRDTGSPAARRPSAAPSSWRASPSPIAPGTERRVSCWGPSTSSSGAGELVILAGGNGSGKTTLVKLIAGLYRPEGGDCSSRRPPGRHHEFEAYRQLFSVVFADGYLFRDLVGLETPGLEEKAQRKACIGSTWPIRSRSRGGAFSTLELSQGQRRRLALLGCLAGGSAGLHPRRMGRKSGRRLSSGSSTTSCSPS